MMMKIALVLVAALSAEIAVAWSGHHDGLKHRRGHKYEHKEPEPSKAASKDKLYSHKEGDFGDLEIWGATGAKATNRKGKEAYVKTTQLHNTDTDRIYNLGRNNNPFNYYYASDKADLVSHYTAARTHAGDKKHTTGKAAVASHTRADKHTQAKGRSQGFCDGKGCEVDTMSQNRAGVSNGGYLFSTDARIAESYGLSEAKTDGKDLEANGKADADLGGAKKDQALAYTDTISAVKEKKRDGKAIKLAFGGAKARLQGEGETLLYYGLPQSSGLQSKSKVDDKAKVEHIALAEGEMGIESSLSGDVDHKSGTVSFAKSKDDGDKSVAANKLYTKVHGLNVEMDGHSKSAVDDAGADAYVKGACKDHSDEECKVAYTAKTYASGAGDDLDANGKGFKKEYSKFHELNKLHY